MSPHALYRRASSVLRPSKERMEAEMLSIARAFAEADRRADDLLATGIPLQQAYDDLCAARPDRSEPDPDRDLRVVLMGRLRRAHRFVQS